jgi:seryl-tRNA synthetase
MLDIKWIRDNPDALETALRNRGVAAGAATAEVRNLIALDEARRANIAKLQEAQERRNAASKEIGKAKAQKDEATAQKLMAEVSALKDDLPKLEDEGRKLEKALEDALAVVPNVPLDDVPVGDASKNAKYREWGRKPTLNSAKEHFELGEALGQMDFETAAKISGSRFVVLKAGLARLERALGQFMLDLHTEEHGYTEVVPPLLVKDEALFGTAQLPKFKTEQFLAITQALPPNLREETLDEQARLLISQGYSVKMDEAAEKLVRLAQEAIRKADIGEQNQFALVRFLDDLLASKREDERRLAELLPSAINVGAMIEGGRWLIPTAEVPLTNLVRESILDEKDLPLRFTALTPCFRSEAGAAGKDTRGMLRQHQFDKVELVSITTPEQSRQEHERMLTCAEEVLKRLDINYRVMTLSTGDMGFGAQKTYDIEVWLPGQGAYREISSCSVCGDFQARRMQARYRPAEGKGTRLVHTLNGSGVAVGRALIAVMENYQNPDGSITVPEVLRPYMGGKEVVNGE